MHGHRAVLEQLPVQRCDQQSLEHRFVLYILDQQITAQLLDALDHAAQRITGEQQFGGHVQAVIAQLLGGVGQPLAVVGE
ncbi:hypothetical protein D3C81_1897070 [compost metagenome]